MTSEQDPDAVTDDPERARSNPEEAVDALERRVLGSAGTRSEDAPDDEAGPDSAFEIDLEPEDQGSAAAAAADPD